MSLSFCCRAVRCWAKVERALLGLARKRQRANFLPLSCHATQPLHKSNNRNMWQLSLWEAEVWPLVTLHWAHSINISAALIARWSKDAQFLFESRVLWHAGVLYAASLWLSNSSYLYLSVSFIQMTKSLMPGLVYACGVALGTEKFTRSAALNMMLIAFGVLICAMGEVNLVIKGVIQQLLALFFEVRPVLPCCRQQ